MPTYLPARNGITLSQAMAESYTSSQVGDVALFTLEIHHPDFRDKFGNVTAARFVNDWVDHTLTLETDAPINAGEAIVFKGMPFKAELPDETDSGAPSAINIEIENVSRDVTLLLDQAIASMVPIEMIIREYMSSDKSAPHKLPVIKMILSNVVVTSGTMSAQAKFGNLTNRRFPGVRYTRQTHPGLAAR